MSWVFLVIGGLVVLGAALYGLHRLLLWAELRGWVFYKEKPRPGAVSNAFLELDAIWMPEIHHVVEERDIEADHEVDAESGDRPFDLATERTIQSGDPDHP